MANRRRHAEWVHFNHTTIPFATDEIQVRHCYRGVSDEQVVTLMSRVTSRRPLILMILTTLEIGPTWIRPLHCIRISICTGAPQSRTCTSFAPRRIHATGCMEYYTTRRTAREFPHPQLSGGSISPTTLPFIFFISRKRIYFWAS